MKRPQVMSKWPEFNERVIGVRKTSIRGDGNEKQEWKVEVQGEQTISHLYFNVSVEINDKKTFKKHLFDSFVWHKN